MLGCAVPDDTDSVCRRLGGDAGGPSTCECVGLCADAGVRPDAAASGDAGTRATLDADHERCTPPAVAGTSNGAPAAGVPGGTVAAASVGGGEAVTVREAAGDAGPNGARRILDVRVGMADNMGVAEMRSGPAV